MQLPINTGLAYDAMFRALEERQKEALCQTNRAKTGSAPKTSMGNYHLFVQPITNKSQLASIERLNGVSIPIEEGGCQKSILKMVGVERQWKKVDA